MKRSELESAIRDEVAEWPGVTVEFIDGSTHPKAKLMFGDNMLYRPYSGTPSDSYNGLHRCLGDMRRIMKQLGAVRDKPEPSKEDVERRYRKPNPGAAMRESPIKSDLVEPGPDVADQLVGAGLATADQAASARASAAIERRDDIEAGDDDPDAQRAAQLAALDAAIEAIEDGIYFGLPDHIYHGVRALGSGSISDLIISPATFWRGSWLDPDRPELDEEQTKAQMLGKAYHVARLEPDRFHQLYCRELSKADFPSRGFLSSGTDIEAALLDLGETKKKSGEKVPDQAQRLADCGYQGTIWPLEQARWKAQLGDRTPIKAEYFDDIVVDMERLRATGEIAELLSGGAAEVSVFWTDQHGLRCKARFDYLKPRLWDDYKTFANPNGKVLAQAIADAFRYNRYYIQAAHYRDAAEAIRTGGLKIIGDATDDERALIAKIQLSPLELACWYIFQEKGGIPNLLARQFQFHSIPFNTELHSAGLDDDRQAAINERTASPTMIFTKALVEIQHAKRLFALYSEIYPAGTPWSPIEPLGQIGDDDFNSFWLEGR